MKLSKPYPDQSECWYWSFEANETVTTAADVENAIIRGLSQTANHLIAILAYALEDHVN